ncbi:MAG: O-antigen ligase family protein [Patescibacteria group bacterium]|nr:O-antigen ligase family protein [Patescibacteria group bacterium]MDD5715803.1 O-antigen ligase family protein [Patescibacteria group bacterium]
MKKIFEKCAEYGIYLFVFFLPWQTRWIWHQGFLAGGHWEYGTCSLYLADIILIVVALLSLSAPKVAAYKPLHQIRAVIVVLFAIAFSSIFWSKNADASWYAAAKLLEGIVLFWTCIRVRFRWERIGAAFVAAGVIQAVLGIYQFFSQRIEASTILGIASHSPDVLGDFVVETASGRFLRAYGGLPHPNMLAALLVICLLIVVAYLFRAYRNRSQNIAGILCAVTSLVILYYGLILTFSRAAIIAWWCACLVLFFVALVHRDTYRVKILTPVLFWIVLVTAFSVLLLPDVWQTRVEGGRLEVKSNTERLSSYREAAEVIEDSWYQGVGIGSYTAATQQRMPGRNVWDYQPVHSIYLLITAETGVFGGLAFVVLCGTVCSMAFWEHRKKFMMVSWFSAYSLAFVVLLALGAVDHYLWSLSFGVLFFWLILGLWAKRYEEFFVDNLK